MILKTVSLFAMATALVLPLSAQEAKVTPTGKAPSKAIHGHWAPNVESALKMMLAEMPPEAKENPAAMAPMKAMMEQMLGQMAFSFSEGESEMITQAGVEKAKWTVVSEDVATGKLSVKITKPDGSSEDGEAIVGKDVLILINPGEGMRISLDRITAEEFKKRKAAAAPSSESAPESKDKAASE